MLSLSAVDEPGHCPGPVPGDTNGKCTVQRLNLTLNDLVPESSDVAASSGQF